MILLQGLVGIFLSNRFSRKEQTMSSTSGTAGAQTLVSTSQPDEAGLPRRNGWSCPWHPFMGIAWFFICFFALSYFGFLVFYIPGLYIIIAIVVRKMFIFVLVNFLLQKFVLLKKVLWLQKIICVWICDGQGQGTKQIETNNASQQNF